MWDVNWKRPFQNVWVIEDMVNLPIFGCTLRPASAIVSPWLTTWSTIVAPILSDIRLCPWPLPLFCLFPPCILTPLLPLGSWPWSFPGCSSIFMIFYLLCCPLSIYAFQLKVHEMHLWAISENWFIICWSIFSSLVKVKIHLHNLWQIYKKSNWNV